MATTPPLRTEAYLNLIRKADVAASVATSSIETHNWMVKAHDIGIQIARDYSTIECKDLVEYILFCVHRDEQVAVLDFLKIKTLATVHQYLVNTFVVSPKTNDGLYEAAVHDMILLLAKALNNRNYYIRSVPVPYCEGAPRSYYD